MLQKLDSLDDIDPAPAAASSPPPASPAKTASSCTPETLRGTHVFTVHGYSSLQGVDDAASRGRFIRSAAFDVGGFDWCLRYYHNGSNGADDGYVSIFLELITIDAEAKTFFDIRILDQYTDSSFILVATRNNSARRVFGTSNFDTDRPTWGSKNFMRRSEIEESVYLRHDRIMIECNLTIIKTPLVKTEDEATMAGSIVRLQMPSTNLSKDLGRLLETKVGADVSFDVGGEIFAAHRAVLMARSPVFRAALYGPMRKKTEQHIVIQDMQPIVFKALLHFMYTGFILPVTDHDLDTDEMLELTKHLLVAADRYGVQGLKTICENTLCISISVDNVATIVALADQYNCGRLKDVCLNFIASSDRLDDVLATDGYESLKTSYPSVLVDIFERATKSRKIN
ncbi:BTB/POZ and MATH domain-containing protein 1-like [Oryza brachyantha]|uniref:BTB domain-containing protein n=1 Tax=Oryza brachyantha TaxID=4533 RepID=J3MRC8_ORYBR|nr:BTB/POZ and MATH domain-containing protein 1-like [Oryza brachyantha]